MGIQRLMIPPFSFQQSPRGGRGQSEFMSTLECLVRCGNFEKVLADLLALLQLRRIELIQEMLNGSPC